MKKVDKKWFLGQHKLAVGILSILYFLGGIILLAVITGVFRRDADIWFLIATFLIPAIYFTIDLKNQYQEKPRGDKKVRRFVPVLAVLCLIVSMMIAPDVETQQTGTDNQENTTTAAFDNDKQVEKTHWYDFAESDLKEYELDYLKFKIPSEWEETTDKDEKDDTRSFTIYGKDGNAIAGIKIEDMGDSEVDGKINKKMLKDSINTSSKEQKNFERFDYAFKNVKQQYVLKYEDTEVKQQWYNYRARIRCNDNKVFSIWAFINKKADINYEKVVRNFFDTVNLEEYKEIKKLVATYSGDTKEYTPMEKINQGITVTAYYNDGTSKEVTGWDMETEGTYHGYLVYGEDNVFIIKYKGRSCKLKIKATEDKDDDFDDDDDDETSNEYNMTESEYKSKCKDYGYYQIATNPEKFKGKYIKQFGKIMQVVDDDGMYLLQVGDDVIFIYAYNATLDGQNEKIIKGEHVTVYGICNGERSYQTVMNTTETVPVINAEYIENN